MWSHVSSLYEDIDTGTITRLHKLTKEHVKLSSYSRMKVKYAVQVCHGSLFTFIHSPTGTVLCYLWFPDAILEGSCGGPETTQFTELNESSDKSCNLGFQTNPMQLFSRSCAN